MHLCAAGCHLLPSAKLFCGDSFPVQAESLLNFTGFFVGFFFNLDDKDNF